MRLKNIIYKGEQGYRKFQNMIYLILFKYYCMDICF